MIARSVVGTSLTPEQCRIKGSNRIAINGLLSAVSLAVISMLLVDKIRVSPWIVGQLSTAIPLLVTSSLAYEKLAYRSSVKEQKAWDRVGRICHSIGYLFVINALVLQLYSFGYGYAAYATLVVVVALHLLTLVTKIAVGEDRRAVAVRRFLLYLATISLGSAGPIIAGWV
jgi:hypothetical protein